LKTGRYAEQITILDSGYFISKTFRVGYSHDFSADLSKFCLDCKFEKAAFKVLIAVRRGDAQAEIPTFDEKGEFFELGQVIEFDKIQ
jgi:hypothetical protein